jgi:hypothetical protein
MVMSDMRYIGELIREYETTKRGHLDERAILVLHMIENSITYPPLERITTKDLSKIDECIKQLVKDLRRDKQYLFSVRIEKIWKKRKHLCEQAKLSHEVKDDYMDAIEYHEEIKWLRNERKRLAQSDLNRPC